MLFYGGYYLIRPSQKGRDILKNLNIPYPSVIAHRGASIEAPESTKAAFILAREQGVDYLEADIQRTKDGKTVIFHDRNLKRLSNVEDVFPNRENYIFENFTYQELLKLDFGSWFNERYPERAKAEYNGLDIITLEELLDIAEAGENNPGLFLEFKYPELYPGIERQTAEILNENGCLKNDSVKIDSDLSKAKKINDENLSESVNSSVDRTKIVFMSFNINSLDIIKNITAKTPAVLLINDNMIGRRSWSNWLDLANERVDGLAPKGFVAWPWHIAAAHDEGLFVVPYVINKAWQVKILSHFKADSFITDKPSLILDFLGRLNGLTPNG